MSKLEQNTTSLDEVLAMVNALPDAGGGSVGTCTVTVTASDGNITNLCYTSANGGQIETVYIDPVGSKTKTLSNVVCGSFVAVIPSVLNFSDMYSGVGTELVGGYIGSTPSVMYYKVTASAGETATIKI